ncbi:hypothetical protein X975_19179, partial [Stegodyphus mimosarum]
MSNSYLKLYFLPVDRTGEFLNSLFFYFTAADVKYKKHCKMPRLSCMSF